MNAKAKGTARERQYRAVREAEGWVCWRAPASLGCADVICALPLPLQPGFGTYLLLAQVKANVGSPWKNFQPAERNALLEQAEAIGASCELVHWPPRKPMRCYQSSEWP